MTESRSDHTPQTPDAPPDDESRAINREIWEGGPVFTEDDTDDEAEPGPGK